MPSRLVEELVGLGTSFDRAGFRASRADGYGVGADAAQQLGSGGAALGFRGGVGDDGG